MKQYFNYNAYPGATDLTREKSELNDEAKSGLLRLYRESPDSFCLQIRSNTSLSDHGKPRLIVSSVHVSIKDLEEMLEFAKESV